MRELDYRPKKNGKGENKHTKKEVVQKERDIWAGPVDMLIPHRSTVPIPTAIPYPPFTEKLNCLQRLHK